MRKTFQIFFVLSLILMWCSNILAQDANMFGLSPYMGGTEKGQPQYQGESPDANTGFGNDAIGTGFPFLSMPIPAGTPFTVLNPSFAPGWLAGGDIGSGVYYGCSYIGSGSSNLVLVDLSTGAPTVLGAITGFTLYPTSLAYNEATSTWYFGSTDGVTSNLYTLNVTTRVATLVGPMTGLAGLIGMAINCTGQAYGVDIITDQLYSINLATGAGTAIGPIGFDASYAQDCDFDGATGTMYLAAYNAGLSQGEFRSVNLGTGGTTLITAWPGSEITGFAIDNTCGPPCPVGAPSNPSPANGATNVPISGQTASWTNGSGTTQVELWFGPQGNLTQVYSGAAINSFPLPTLAYSTTYAWYVKCGDGTCFSQGPTWSFTTEQDPNLFCETVDIYPQNVNYWTGTCNTSTKTQVSLVNAVQNDVGWMVFDLSLIVNDPSTYINTIDFYGYLYDNSWPYWSITPMGSVNPVTADAATINAQVSNNYQQGVAYSYNQESGTLTNGWINRALETTAPTDMKNALGQGWFAIGIVDFDFSSSWYVYFQGWSEANKPYLRVNYCYVVPVELTSFTATANFGVVELQWITATETNNQGFEVQRSAGGEFETIAFVEGHGTTTQTQAYSYTDKSVDVGSYTYRLKQIDFDGTFEYSNVIEVDVPAPAEFALDQNYPNPFNPSTKIAFRLAVDSKVSLKVFDILGQEVATLVNTNLAVGAHSIDFDASSLNSGVYLYRIEATGIDGTNFVDVKKMILTK